jgi:hypothetical protein
MQSFPRLAALFGAPVDALDESAIQSAINSRIREDFDLDWKEAHYPKHKNRDIASDVAQLANTFGGIIVLGVKEKNGCADAPSHVSLGDNEERRIRELITERVRPFLPGVTFHSVGTSPDMGYLIIVVPQSADAPHAVVHDNRALAYPVRDGTKTRWLTEYEVAARYRDRYLGRAAVSDMLSVIHMEGVSRIALWQYPWLAVSLVPFVKGERPIGSKGLAAERDFMLRWKTNSPPLRLFGDVRLYPGIRRAVATETLQYEGRSAYPHAELHYDGSGFGGTWRLFEPAGQSDIISGHHDVAADKILQDAMELQILALVLFLARHAVDTGAMGECQLRAQQLLRQQTGLEQPITPAQMCEPCSFTGRGERDTYEVVESSLTLGAQTRTADTSAFLDELVSDLHAVVQVSHGLATDILGEFGVSEPVILRSDGQLNVHNLHRTRRAPIEAWAQQEGLVAPLA